MKRVVFLVALAVLLIAGTSYGAFIPDTYLHPNDVDGSYHQNLDVIGPEPPFQIFGSEWVDDYNLKISLDWNLGLDGVYSPTRYQAKLGDLFLYTDDGVFAVALRSHTFENSFDPTAPAISAGTIFKVEGTYSSDWYFDLTDGKVFKIPTTSYGDHEIVAAYGTAMGQVAGFLYDLDNIDPSSNYIQISFADTSFANSPLRITMTCANDVHVVPEPLSLLLLGLGLLGAGIYGRRVKTSR